MTATEGRQRLNNQKIKGRGRRSKRAEASLRVNIRTEPVDDRGVRRVIGVVTDHPEAQTSSKGSERRKKNLKKNHQLFPLMKRAKP